MAVPKNKILFSLLIIVLVALMAVRYAQFTAPLHPRLISLDDTQRNGALAQLSKLDEAKRTKLLSQLTADLEKPDPRVRRFALYAIRKTGSLTDKTLNAVGERLSDSDADVRDEAAVVLLESGDKGYAVAAQVLRNGNEVAVQAAAKVLARPDTPALPLVIQFVKSGRNPAGQRQAMALLRKWGPAAAEAGPILTDQLESGEAPAKREAALALVAVSSENKAAIPVLTACIKQSFDAEAVDALAALGPAAKAAIPVLNQRLQEGKDSLTRDNAPRPLIARALAKIDPRKSDLVGLSWDIKQKNALIRYRAAYELSRRKDLNAGAIPQLVHALNDPDPFVAGRLAYALVKLDLNNAKPMAKEAYPKLSALLKRVSDEKHIEGFHDMLAPELVKIAPARSASTK